MPHFFINSNDVKENKIILSDKENYVHIVKALRAKIGEKILLIDENEIQYEGIISSIFKSEIEIDIKKSYKSSRKLDFELFLAQSPLRSESQATIIEKATELGVKGIYPIYTDNCALKKNIIEQKIEKWQKIMKEASKQCERANLPTCFNLFSMEKLISETKFDRILVFAERNTQIGLKNYLRNNPILKNEKILAIIGPEGGFSQKEFDFFKEKNLPMLSLGNLILKAETAVITAVGNIIYEFDN